MAAIINKEFPNGFSTCQKIVNFMLFSIQWNMINEEPQKSKTATETLWRNIQEAWESTRTGPTLWCCSSWQIKTMKMFSNWKGFLVLPEFLYDSTTGNSQRNSSHRSNCQRNAHGKFGRPEILEKPEEIRLEESPNSATDKEDDQEHEDVWSHNQFTEILILKGVKTKLRFISMYIPWKSF